MGRLFWFQKEAMIVVGHTANAYCGSMLIKRAILDMIVSGEVNLAFRRWKRPTVKSGGRLRTAVGELAIDGVSKVSMDCLTAEDARRAGYDSVEGLLADLSQRPHGEVFRIALRYSGEDHRKLLRDHDDLSDAECAEIVKRINRTGQMVRVQDLSLWILTWIERWPERRAQDLADEIGMEKQRLKNHIRKLKELGLTESMQTGYTLSARGRRVLRFIGSKSD